MRDILINFAIGYTLGALFFDILAIVIGVVRGIRGSNAD